MFQFESVSLNDILKEIANLKSAKNGTFKIISARFLKEVADIFSPILTRLNN